MGAKPYIIELDQIGMPSLSPMTSLIFLDDGSNIQAALKEITSQSSVPNIFIGQQHIGGNSDLQAKKAELPTLLKEAGAV